MLSQMINRAILKKARAVAAESDQRSLHSFMFFRLEGDIVVQNAKQLATAGVLCLLPVANIM